MSSGEAAKLHIRAASPCSGQRASGVARGAFARVLSAYFRIEPRGFDFLSDSDPVKRLMSSREVHAMTDQTDGSCVAPRSWRVIPRLSPALSPDHGGKMLALSTKTTKHVEARLRPAGSGHFRLISWAKCGALGLLLASAGCSAGGGTTQGPTSASPGAGSGAGAGAGASGTGPSSGGAGSVVDSAVCLPDASLAPARVWRLTDEEYVNVVRQTFGVTMPPEVTEPVVPGSDY